MTPDPLVEEFAALFAGRTDVHGTEQGGAFRRGDGGSMSSWRWWVETCRQHLDDGGDHAIGAYPMVPREIGYGEIDWYVTWGCIDYDEGEAESWVHAVNTHNVCLKLGAQTWIERSRSKGYHVWLIPLVDTPAETMRHALLAAAQIAGAPTKEINPKQTSLGTDSEGRYQLGNYVRLPYPNGHGERRQMWTPDEVPLSLEYFLEAASSNMVPAVTIERMAELYAPPAPIQVTLPTPTVAAHIPAERRLDGLAWTIYDGGPLGGSDRSETLWKLCREMATSQVTFGEAETLLREADRRWGKFHNRADGGTVLHNMLVKAWT